MNEELKQWLKENLKMKTVRTTVGTTLTTGGMTQTTIGTTRTKVELLLILGGEEVSRVWIGTF